MRLFALFMLALSGVFTPALAQDRTPPTTDLRAYAPPIDWTASQTRPPRSDFYGLANDLQTAPRRSGNTQPGDR